MLSETYLHEAPGIIAITDWDVCLRDQCFLRTYRKGPKQELQSLQSQGQTVRSQPHLDLPLTLRSSRIQPVGSVATLRAGDVEDYQVRSCSTCL